MHPLFAVKTPCHKTTEKLFEKEAQALKRMMTTEPNKPYTHRSLIRLLATIKHGQQYHMIFPWAEANLHEFWKDKYPDPDFPPRNAGLTQWMAWELLGLAEAISRVHHPVVLDGDPQDMKEERHRILGCHGDIKPQNILFFLCRPLDTKDPGNFQLADFGFARFHGKDSVRVPVETAGLTQRSIGHPISILSRRRVET